MSRFARTASLLALTLGLCGPAAAEGAEAWRLFVADHTEPKLRVLDALKGEEIAAFDLQGPAALHRTSSGETVFAVQGAAGVVTAISSGIALEDHGDHADLEIEAPHLLDLAVSGSKPAHFLERQGRAAQFFDGESFALLFDEAAARRGEAKFVSVPIAAPHHGVAVPYRGHAVVSIPNPEDPSKRPVGARALKDDGTQVGEDAACPGLHGSAGSGAVFALACDTGLLLIREEGGVPKISHQPYAASLPEGSSSTLLGGQGLSYFLGNFGPDRIAIYDPAEGEATRLVQLPTRRVHFVTDPVRPRFAWVFTEDGSLRRLDVVAGELSGELALTEPYSMDGHWSDPRPRVAVAGDKIVVTDPLKGKLHLVDAESLAKTGEIAVAGKPFNIVAVGGSGAVHAHEEGHDH